MPADVTLTLAAPAKVNLALSVGGRRDDGLHPIASWFLAVDLADDLTLTRRDATAFDIAFADDAPAPGRVDWPLDRDLAVRAHALLERHIGGRLPVAATLRKRIPAGGGLGGGSSDAAAMLVGLDRLFDLRLGEPVLRELALTLGSDVPFFVGVQHGRRSALVTGVGEALEPAAVEPDIALVLILPELACPTGPVYAAFDAMRPDTGPPDVQRVRRLMAGPLRPEAPFNDLAEPAMRVTPALRAVADRLRAALQWPIHVSGSGSTLFALASDRNHAAQLAAAAQQLGLRTW